MSIPPTVILAVLIAGAKIIQKSLEDDCEC